ncbi:MAG: hypothetical protein NZ951_03580 [Dehalococcoidia bacterium]|nr:hypothetical protein [Dehalococcoidia bacterium]MDW8119337.1 hypothetical protein [Chloroflexota bacterium]
MPYLRSSPPAHAERERSPTPPDEGEWTTVGIREPREGTLRRSRGVEETSAPDGKGQTATPTDTRPILTPLRRGEVGTDLYHAHEHGSWSWERWGQSSEQLLKRVARDLEMFHWGGIGLLVGLVVAGIPAFDFGFERYPFVVAQPLGALVGALIGSGLVWLRWHKQESGS